MFVGCSDMPFMYGVVAVVVGVALDEVFVVVVLWKNTVKVLFLVG